MSPALSWRSRLLLSISSREELSRALLNLA